MNIHDMNRMERKMFIALAMFVLLFASCDGDKPGDPEVETSDEVLLGSVKTTAFSASISGSFNGISKVDLALGKSGVLYCPKSDDAASKFKSWLDGNDNPDCIVSTNGVIQVNEYKGVITNLYPETEYDYCLFLQSQDSKTRKISSISTFTTGSFNPVIKAIDECIGLYVGVLVTFEKVEMNELDESGCTIGLLVSEKSGGVAGPGSTLTPLNGNVQYYEEWSNRYTMTGYGVKPDNSYYCRIYVKYKDQDGNDAYKYGPEKSFSARSSEMLIIDLDLPSGIKWAQCDLGETGVRAISDEGYQYFRWGSLKMFNGNRNVSANKGQYEYWDEASKSYMNIGDDIKNTEYDAAHIMLGGKWRMPTKAEVQELIDNTTIHTWGVGSESSTEGKKRGSGWRMTRRIGDKEISVSFVIGIGGFWTSTYEDGYPVAFDFTPDSYNDGYAVGGSMIFVTGLGGEYARHIRPVWDPNM